MTQEHVELPDDLRTWIEEVTHGRLTRADRQAGGGRKQAWLVDVQQAGQPDRQLFLRWDPSDPATTGDPWTVRREAEVYRALSTTAIPVARYVALHPTAQALLVSRVSGRNWFSQITDPDEQLSVASDFIAHLAALHRLDVNELDMPGWGARSSVAEHVSAQLDEMEAIISFRGGDPEPVLSIALRWLGDNIPAYDGPLVLVQGDTGPGNFMYEAGKVTAIVDWELAHLGDPMDDIAWVTLRAVQEPFTDLRQRFAEYAALSGHQLDIDRIRYYRVLAEAKILVMSHGLTSRDRSAGPGGGGDTGAALVFGQLHRRLCAEALCDVLDYAVPPIEIPVEPATNELDELFDVVLAQLRYVISPRITDSFALQRTKGMARVVKYLAAATRRRQSFEAQELDELATCLGAPSASVAEGRRHVAAGVRAGSIDALAALTAICHRLQRDNELLREASGALADRHYTAVT
jgi:aminoglycoside phosphotransferase (APT) family kinase protein